MEQRAPLSEINVTPFVDITLVLLIIFMVTAPMMQQSINVTLPKASTGEQSGDTGLAITLTKDHLIYLDKDLVTLKDLRERLRAAGGGRPVMIRADRHAYVDKLMELWDLCRDTGFREVHIATLAD